MGLWPPASRNIINHDNRRCWATNPRIGHCVLLSGCGGGGTEVGNEDDCIIEGEGDGQVEILDRMREDCRKPTRRKCIQSH